MKMLYDWGWRSRNYISVSIELLERQEDKHWFLIVDKEADRALGILLSIYVGIIFELYLINIPDPQNNQRRGQTKDALDRVCVQWSLTLLWWWRPRRDGLCWISSNIIFTTTAQYTSQPGGQDSEHKNNSDKCGKLWPHHHRLLIFWW